MISHLNTSGVILSVGLLVGGGGLAQAQGPQRTVGPSALDRCVAAADKARTSAPTEFKCDWRAVLKTAPGAALSGRYGKVGRTPSGTLTVLERGNGPALIGVMTTAARTGRTCVVAVEALREPSDLLVARPTAAPGCVISVRSTRLNIVRVSTTAACQFYCGVGVGFDGDYKLTR